MDASEVVKIVIEVAAFLGTVFVAGIKLSNIEKKSDTIRQEMQSINALQNASLTSVEQKLTDKISNLSQSLQARMELDNEKTDHNITKKLDGIDKRISSIEDRLGSIEVSCPQKPVVKRVRAKTRES